MPFFVSPVFGFSYISGLFRRFSGVLRFGIFYKIYALISAVFTIAFAVFLSYAFYTESVISAQFCAFISGNV